MVRRYVGVLVSWFRGCGVGGAIHLGYGIVLGMSSIPALVYVSIRYSWLLAFPNFSLLGIAVFILIILLLASTTYLWEQRVSGVTSIDYSFIEAVYCRRKLALFLTYISGPVFEEVVYRGLIQYTLSSLLGPWVALLIAALAFAIPHIRTLGTKNTPLILAVSLTLGLLLIVYDSLIPPILAHITVNIAGSIRRLKEVVLSINNE